MATTTPLSLKMVYCSTFDACTSSIQNSQTEYMLDILDTWGLGSTCTACVASGDHPRRRTSRSGLWLRGP